MGKRLFYAILCVTGLFALLSSTLSKSPVLIYFAESLATPVYLMGFIASASTIPGVLASLPAGTLSDRWGSAKVIIASGVIFASAPFLYLFVTGPLQLIAVRFYHGFATAIFGPVANAAIVARFPESKAEKISLFSSITYIGRFTAPLLGGYILLTSVSNFNELYLIDGIMGALALLIAVWLRENGGRGKEGYTGIANDAGNAEKAIGRRSLRRDWKEVAANGKVLAASFVEATQYYTIGAFEFYVVAYAKDVLGLDPFSVGIIALVEPLAVFLGKPAMGRLSDRVGRRTPIRLGLILGAIALIVFPFAAGFIQLTVVSVAYGLGISLVTSSTPPLVTELCRKEVCGSALGFLSTLMDVGQVLGPIVTGLLLAATFGYFISFAHLGVVLLLSFFVFSISTRGRKASA
ncbi:MAG: MFS transporter [Candidatus Atabeyarchaeum deiterrae]